MATTTMAMAMAMAMTADAVRAARRILSGIRVRVVVGYVGLVAVALSVGVIVTRQALQSDLDRRIEADLAQEAEELRSLAAGTDPATGQPFGPDTAAIFDTFLARNVPNRGEAFFTLVDGAPYRFSSDPPAQLLADDDLVERWRSLAAPSRRTVQSSAGETRVLAVPLRQDGTTRGVFVVAAFVEEDLDELAHAIRNVSAASAVVLALSAAVAWGLAARVIRPVRELTATARQITGSDLTARIPVEGRDELAELGGTFNDMVDRLEEGIRGQRQFLDDVAHELRTPLTIIRGHLETLGDDPRDRGDSVAIVTDELDRMSRYVSDLLVLARANEPDFCRLEPVDLGELAHTLLHKVEALGPRRWVLDDAPRPGLVAAVADVDRINQAMVSLADNAVQHTRDGDEIGLGVCVVDRHVRLWVRDTGPGVPAQLQAQIFDRSVRGAASRASRPAGMGIGLSIVAAIARAHGGDVVVEASPGTGATFTITLPLDPEESPP